MGPSATAPEAPHKNRFDDGRLGEAIPGGTVRGAQGIAKADLHGAGIVIVVADLRGARGIADHRGAQGIAIAGLRGAGIVIVDVADHHGARGIADNRAGGPTAGAATTSSTTTGC